MSSGERLDLSDGEEEEGDEGDYFELDDDEEYEAYHKNDDDEEDYDIHPSGYRVYKLDAEAEEGDEGEEAHKGEDEHEDESGIPDLERVPDTSSSSTSSSSFISSTSSSSSINLSSKKTSSCFSFSKPDSLQSSGQVSFHMSPSTPVTAPLSLSSIPKTRARSNTTALPPAYYSSLSSASGTRSALESTDHTSSDHTTSATSTSPLSSSSTVGSETSISAADAAASTSDAVATAQADDEQKTNIRATCTSSDILSYCCDSVEYCPDLGGRSLFACANYELVSRSDQKKVGRILLYEDDDGIMNEVFRMDTPAVFDLKWSWANSASHLSMLAAAYADGGLEIFEMKDSQLQRLTFQQDSHPTTSVCWNNQFQKTSFGLASSYANGSIAFWQLASDSLSNINTVTKAHDAEVWVVSHNQWQPNLAYSGADDCRFKLWDVRRGSASIMTNSSHSMGVCTIQTHPSVEHTVATGSYDEQVLIWDDRNWKQPVGKHQLGGGVWRVKWHPTDSTLLVAACMHNGFHVVKLNSEPSSSKSSLETTNSFYHQSLAYGVDWSFQASRTPVIAACSFYDRALNLWKVEL